MITMDTADSGPVDEIARLIRAFDDPTRALKAVGEQLVEFTKTRFELSRGPYGQPWAANADAMLSGLLHRNAKKNFHATASRLIHVTSPASAWPMLSSPDSENTRPRVALRVALCVASALAIAVA